MDFLFRYFSLEKKSLICRAAFWDPRTNLEKSIFEKPAKVL